MTVYRSLVPEIVNIVIIHWQGSLVSILWVILKQIRMNSDAKKHVLDVNPELFKRISGILFPY